MHTTDTFTFEDNPAGGAAPAPPVTITIRQLIDADYGGFIWPSSHVLAQYVWQNRQQFTGKRVLEVSAVDIIFLFSVSALLFLFSTILQVPSWLLSCRFHLFC